jgi:outer membrane protease
VYGVSREIVWNGSARLSELDWDLKALATAGLAVDWTLPSGMRLGLSARAGLPGRTGSLQDYDWLGAGGWWTNYSRHDARVDGALLADLELGWGSSAGALRFEPFVGLGAMYFNWTATDGYLQYIPYPYTYTVTPPDVAPVPIYGTGIIYRQAWLWPALGLKASWSPARSLDLRASFAFSPSVYCADEDFHALRSVVFTETMGGGFLLEPRLSLDWRAAERVSLRLEIGYRAIAGLRGDSYARLVGTSGSMVSYGSGSYPAGTVFKYPDSGGAAYEAAEASLALRLSL